MDELHALLSHVNNAVINFAEDATEDEVVAVVEHLKAALEAMS